MTWTERDIPDQTGRTVLITGANSGLGLRSAQVLAAKGARVLMACRSPERGKLALDAVPGDAELVQLDLADLASVREAARRVRELTGDKLDVLVNNAGVMATPHRRTADGFELQLGTNHLGHAALTWLLMPALRGGDNPRVVTLSSLAHRLPGFDLTDLNFEKRRYNPTSAYNQSKLANLLFAVELHRRAAGTGLTSVAAHPGFTDSDLVANTVRSFVGPSRVGKVLTTVAGHGYRLFNQSTAKGALPQLYAATAPEVRSGTYYGPSGPGELWGAPAPAKQRGLARDDAAAAELWRITAEMTGVTPDPR
ncbi:oxidoreductase [Labedaea rhizosphaerae]|uniref:Protochlorophyllide reductase n=1 Tax=Labedaea rhizosphaerae TaxID=598644 RepID=A0A4R6SAZ1_LABRH|nr:oxidoreductase [Labedaea rhizosphaerae]TDP96136.1 protochlorophyllide reductase [Labedaea rhizosphaerae]